MRTPLGAFCALADFLGALNHQLGSTSFLAIVDTRSIFGDMKSQEPECANLAENAWFAYNRIQMLCSGSVGFKICCLSVFFEHDNSETQRDRWRKSSQ
ncbi:hypothetical protein AVEN_67621-1 [Araneus ventricosus]|uniref:Uncharacterized protein n=1 Tax=Araneus ventricosus TaxID=182803 RepID=A0A4Y2SWB1_ARAVE|nr:hypothetical protein AVEN_67621-1 [Araneus ventricosus]